MRNVWRVLFVLTVAWGGAWALLELRAAQTVTVCKSGCNSDSLQTAMDRIATCGDTIRIRETQIGNFTFTDRGCGSNPITVTSDRAEWLPEEGTRITPSHLANMATIATPNTSPALAAVLSSAGKPPAGWAFVGIAFTTRNSVTYALVDLAGFNFQPKADADTPDNIVFDRCYFVGMSPNATGASVQNVLRANGRNVVVKNSFIGDAAWPGVESHGIFMLEAPGPVTIENNYIVASSIPIFGGGAVPSYPVVPSNLKVRYNYTFRPWKWNRDPAQPYAADYVANSQKNIRSGLVAITAISTSGVVTVPTPFVPVAGTVIEILGAVGCQEANNPNWRATSLDATRFQLVDFPGCSSTYQSGGTASDHSYGVCQKNHGELKFADTVLWQYNVGENSWKESDCQSQRSGFTNTTRTHWDYLPGARMQDISHVSWDGAFQVGGPNSCCGSYTNDLGLCLSLPVTGTECRPVADFHNDQKVMAVSTPFSSVSTNGPMRAWVSYTGSARLTNLTLSNNVWRNVSQGLTVLGYSFSNGIGDAGYGKNHTVENNLWWNPYSYGESQVFFSAAAGEADYIYDTSDYKFRHNTFYSATPVTMAFAFFAGQGCGDCSTKRQPRFKRMEWSNNLMGASATLPFFGDAWNGIKDAVDAYLADSKLQNNVIPGAISPNGCGGSNTCSGNITTDWVDPFVSSVRGVAKIALGNRVAKAATDGKDIGADFDQLPLINNLQVTAGFHSAILEFDLSAPIADAGATQPCVLEVSRDRNLYSDLGSYSLIPDLDPMLFRRADSSKRTNSKLAKVMVMGGHVVWDLGTEDATPVTPDNGASGLDLQLVSGELHYGRLMCYGDTQLFTFRTGVTPRRRNLQFKVIAPPGVTAIRVRYGIGQKELEGMVEFKPGRLGDVNLEIPVEATPTAYLAEFLAGSKVVSRLKSEIHP